MKVAVALGGNALLRRGERPDSDIQESHVASAVDALAPGAAVCLICRTLVRANGPAFDHPSKFVGPVYDKATAVRLAADHGWDVREDGPSWPRVVPSPEPTELVELDTIRLLVGHGVTVVCSGGGGIPVVDDCSAGLRGVDAVVDKDLTAAALARAVGADALLLLTDVDAVVDGYGTPQARTPRWKRPAASSRRPAPSPRSAASTRPARC